MPQIDFDTAVSIQAMNQELRREVEKLSKENENLRQQFKRRPLDTADFAKRIAETVRIYEGTVNPKTVSDALIPAAREFFT